MNCDRFEKYIALSAGGDLPLGDQEPLNSHLAACIHCRRFAEEMNENRNEWRLLCFEVPDEALMAHVRRNVLDAVAELPEGRQPTVRQWSRRLAFAGAAAAVALGILALWLADSQAPGEAGKTDRALPVAGNLPEPPAESKSAATPPAENSATAPERRSRPAGNPAAGAPTRAAIEHLKPAVEPLRLELQTADPNVRIIWFIPPSETGKIPTRPIGG
jgi:anti-sigma factor RsiW